MVPVVHPYLISYLLFIRRNLVDAPDTSTDRVDFLKKDTESRDTQARNPPCLFLRASCSLILRRVVWRLYGCMRG
jgi:hypothetical protein